MRLHEIDWRLRYSNSESFFVGSSSFRNWFLDLDPGPIGSGALISGRHRCNWNPLKKYQFWYTSTLILVRLKSIRYLDGSKFPSNESIVEFYADWVIQGRDPRTKTGWSRTERSGPGSRTGPWPAKFTGPGPTKLSKSRTGRGGLWNPDSRNIIYTDHCDIIFCLYFRISRKQNLLQWRIIQISVYLLGS